MLFLDFYPLARYGPGLSGFFEILKKITFPNYLQQKTAPMVTRDFGLYTQPLMTLHFCHKNLGYERNRHKFS